ncbi:MAG: DUF4224 domain-containing protein [Pseudomonadota bacterium]
MSARLTQEEIREITGYKLPGKQEDKLRELGYSYWAGMPQTAYRP